MVSSVALQVDTAFVTVIPVTSLRLTYKTYR